MRRDPTGELYVTAGLNHAEQNALAGEDILEDVYADGQHVRDQSFSEVRARLDASR